MITYDSFKELVEGERIGPPTGAGERLNGTFNGGDRTAFARFKYAGRTWKLDADSDKERVLRAYKCLESGEDPFVVTTTATGTCCLDLVDELKAGTKAKLFYAYEI